MTDARGHTTSRTIGQQAEDSRIEPTADPVALRRESEPIIQNDAAASDEHADPTSAPRSQEAATGDDTTTSSERPLVTDGEVMRGRWESVQVGFVDDPPQAVQEAQQLVGEVISSIVDGFRQQHAELEKSGSGGHDASTDEMRRTFQRYRTFFDRLLSA